MLTVTPTTMLTTYTVHKPSLCLCRLCYFCEKARLPSELCRRSISKEEIIYTYYDGRLKRDPLLGVPTSFRIDRIPRNDGFTTEISASYRTHLMFLGLFVQEKCQKFNIHCVEKTNRFSIDSTHNLFQILIKFFLQDMVETNAMKKSQFTYH